MGEIVINKINKYENYIVCKKLRSGMKRKKISKLHELRIRSGEVGQF